MCQSGSMHVHRTNHSTGLCTAMSSPITSAPSTNYSISHMRCGIQQLLRNMSQFRLSLSLEKGTMSTSFIFGCDPSNPCHAVRTVPSAILSWLSSPAFDSPLLSDIVSAMDLSLGKSSSSSADRPYMLT